MRAGLPTPEQIVGLNSTPGNSNSEVPVKPWSDIAKTLPPAPASERASRACSTAFHSTRQATLALTQTLSAEDCAIQSMPDASPVKWHLAHTTWFFETFVLAPHHPGYCVFDPAFRMLFNSYYNAVGDKHPRPERGLLSRPALEDVLAYRRHVDAAMLDMLSLSQPVPCQ